ncbi:hypothetical protein JKF63_01274 [Porcisia hertigi]|uniref:Major facilitator superfamily (MFS) profile domain-containing protein n=1 Tax=Porcisia hertigi TaxID=2761500 RepID=A0A836L363_9TRYP|nr:hypothetical protein JKF63_01274 [Porcisia hertigi]
MASVSVDNGTQNTEQASSLLSERNPSAQRGVKETPLPWNQLSTLCVVLLTESICSFVLIPFVPSFIAYIKGWDVERAGYASGFPVGLFMLGQVISGKIWGTLSDMVGRKLAISAGVLGCAICMFFFGLSESLWAMCLWRFVHGLLAGCSIAAKTMINDLTDTTNRAKGLALVSLTWGVGTLLGPTVGGSLYNPASSSALAFLHISPTGFVGRHPAFLPSTVAAMYNLFAVVISVLFLRESNKDARPLCCVLPPSIVAIFAPVLKFVQPRLPCDDNAVEVTVVCASDCSGVSSTAHKKRAIAADCATRTSAPHSSFGFKEAFLNPLLRNVCIISMLISISDMIFAESFPLWSVADCEHGGLELSPSRMANLILVNSVPAVLANIVFARVIQYAGGPTRLWIVSQLTYAFLTVVMPFATSLGGNGRFWYTMAIGMLRKAVECWCFGLIMVVVSLTAPRGRVGIMFGIQQSTACMVRCVVPFIFAPLFAWSIERPHSFPFNHHLVFLFSANPLLIAAYMTAGISIPSGDGISEAEDDNLLQMEEGSNGDRSGSGSRRGSVRSQYSFFGSVNERAQENDSLFRNSFAELAKSLATNFTPGMDQNTILAVPRGAPSQLPEERGAGATGSPISEGVDSRENSGQECDEVDIDAEYAASTDEMTLPPPTIQMRSLKLEERLSHTG